MKSAKPPATASASGGWLVLHGAESSGATIQSSFLTRGRSTPTMLEMLRRVLADTGIPLAPPSDRCRSSLNGEPSCGDARQGRAERPLLCAVASREQSLDLSDRGGGGRDG